MINLYKMTLIQWIISGDTGISSKLIWAVMMGVKPQDTSAPYDSGYFGHCYRLLKHVSEWLPRLPEVADKYPSWKPIIREWDALTFLHETAQYDELTKMLKTLRTAE